MKTMIRMYLAAVFCLGITDGLAGYSADITNCHPVAGGFMVEWVPRGEAVVKWSPDLITPFTDLSAKLPSTQSSYIDTVHGTDNQCFYLVELDAPEGMAFIPAGTFQMGDTFAEGAADELPVHSVYVSGFYMDTTEVTKAQWDVVYNWAVAHDYEFENAGLGKASDHPVHTINWYDCIKWCNARSEKEERTPCYNLADWSCNWNANGYRLPTEAEWEKAARGGLDGKRYGWGDLITHNEANYASVTYYDYDVSSTRGPHPVYNDGVHPYSSPVGSFAPNGYGLYDMAGNMWEWCWDVFDRGYYATSPASNPHGPSMYSNRVRRGGNWYDDSKYCRSTWRSQHHMSGAEILLGFRTVVSAE